MTAPGYAIAVSDGDGRVEVYGPYGKRPTAERVAEFIGEQFDSRANVAPGLRVEVVRIRDRNSFEVEDYVF
jgi:hypothetical protein